LKTQRERDEERRQEKLELIQEQIKSGTLVVRKMTDEERASHQPREPRRKRR
jgi:anti-sigma28 factor (negative regulator of flagellin synthesis)